jgi:hypothetical protein
MTGPGQLPAIWISRLAEGLAGVVMTTPPDQFLQRNAL